MILKQNRKGWSLGSGLRWSIYSGEGWSDCSGQRVVILLRSQVVILTDFSTNPYSPAIRGILLEINPDVQNRLPKRRVEPQLRKKAADQTAAQPSAGAKTASTNRAPDSEKTVLRKTKSFQICKKQFQFIFR